VAVAIACGVTCCGLFDKGDHAAPAVPPAVPDGTYSVSAPVCASSGTSPAYLDARYVVALRDFAAFSERRITVVGGLGVVESFKDSDCTLTVKRSLIANRDGRLVYSTQQLHSWEPQDCTLAVAFDGTLFRRPLAGRGAPARSLSSETGHLPNEQFGWAGVFHPSRKELCASWQGWCQERGT
jgi:hypothetical protein